MIEVGIRDRVRIARKTQTLPFWRGQVEALVEERIDQTLREYLYDKIMGQISELLGSQYEIFWSAIPARALKQKNLHQLIGFALQWLAVPARLAQQLLEETVLERRGVLLTDWLRSQLIDKTDCDTDSGVGSEGMLIKVDFTIPRKSKSD